MKFRDDFLKEKTVLPRRPCGCIWGYWKQAHSNWSWDIVEEFSQNFVFHRIYPEMELFRAPILGGNLAFPTFPFWKHDDRNSNFRRHYHFLSSS